jgi:hypothetical protein
VALDPLSFVLAQRQAGHAECGGLFLQAATVGEHQRRVLPQMQEAHVGLRVHQPDARAQVQARRLQRAARARMHREDQRKLLGDGLQRPGDGRQVGRRRRRWTAGAASHPVTPARCPIRLQLALDRIRWEAGRRIRARAVRLVHHVVHHHMAHVVDARFGLAFARRLSTPLGSVTKNQSLMAVGDDAVDLFGHRHVAAAQAGLDVRHRDAGLLGHDGAGQRGVHVAHHHHGVGPVGGHMLLKGFHDARRLRRMAAAAAVEVHVGRRDAQFLEEHVAHVAVVSAGRCAPASSAGGRRRCSARTMGAIFMKLGRAPATSAPPPPRSRWPWAGAPRTPGPRRTRAAGLGRLGHRVVHMHRHAEGLQLADHVDHLGVAQVRAVLLEGQAQHGHVGALDRLAQADHLLDGLLGDVLAHAVVDAPAGQDDLRVVAQLSRPCGSGSTDPRRCSGRPPARGGRAGSSTWCRRPAAPPGCRCRCGGRSARVR